MKEVSGNLFSIYMPPIHEATNTNMTSGHVRMVALFVRLVGYKGSSLYVCRRINLVSLSLLLQQVTTVDPYSDHSYYIWILQSPDRDEILVFPESPLHKV